MKLSSIIIIIGAIGMLGACSGIEPPLSVITPRGVPDRIAGGSLTDGSDILAQRFRNDFAIAAEHRGDENVDNMLRSGAMLVYANCSLYFAEKATGQQRSRVMRAAVAPVSAVLTGAIALIDMGQSDRDDLLQVLALGSAAGAAGLNIYEQHFLFDADNIDGVRTLTLEAISAHRDLAIERENLTFEDGVMHLMDIQSICTPAHILTLVRGSIRNSKLVDENSGKKAEEDEETDQGPINIMPGSDKGSA